MKEIAIDKNGAGKRLDKFLAHYLSGAPKSLLYAQLRKKNITLNGRKAAGDERLAAGDAVQCFFSDETWEKFVHPALRFAADAGSEEGRPADSETTRAYRGDAENASEEPAFAAQIRMAERCFHRHPEVAVLYEDADVLLADKPAGLLTQSAARGDESLNDWLLGYLFDSGALTAASLASFRPSACHRLDRNTGGIVVCAKTLPAAQALAALFREHRIGKYYLAAVHGRVREAATLSGALVKDRASNRAAVYDDREAAAGGNPGRRRGEKTTAAAVKARVRPLRYDPRTDVTLVEAQLITGRSHQLRAQLAAAHHPIVGDRKYGGEAARGDERRFGAKWQMLHCARVVFPEADGALAGVSGRMFLSEAPFGERFSTAAQAAPAESAGNLRGRKDR